jgi:hypothetical protein
MKRQALILSFIVFMAFSPNLIAQSSNFLVIKPLLEVYYFHATNRCPTCLSIEDNTKKTLEAYFAKEIKDGKIKLTILNADESKNKTICEKYEVAGSTLLLVKTANGKETKDDMTNFAFSYSRNQPEKFMAGLKEKIQKLIN